MIWGDYYAGECSHGRQARTCRQCARRDRDVPTWAVVVAAIVWLVVLLWLGPRALDQEHDTHPQHAAQEVTR